MKTKTIKIIYPKHFVACFDLQSDLIITSQQIIAYIKDKGMLEQLGNDQYRHLYKILDGGSYQQIQQKIQTGTLYLLDSNDTSLLDEYLNESKYLEQQNNNNKLKEEEKIQKNRQIKIEEEQKRVTKLQKQNNHKSQRNILTPQKIPLIESHQQKLEEFNLMKSEIVSRKTVEELENKKVNSVKITKKNVLNIMKLVKDSENESITIKYYLGKVLLLQQNVKKMSVIRHKIRDIYYIFQDEEMTQEIKKVTIALGDKIYYCKRKLESDLNQEWKNDFVEQSEVKENPQQHKQHKPIFRVTRKKIALKNDKLKEEEEKVETIEQNDNNLQRFHKNGSILHVRKIARTSEKKIMDAYRSQVDV